MGKITESSEKMTLKVAGSQTGRRTSAEAVTPEFAVSSEMQ